MSGLYIYIKKVFFEIIKEIGAQIIIMDLF